MGIVDLVSKHGIAIPGGKIIFKEGEEANNLYLLVEGEVEILKKIKNAQKVLAVTQKGDIFGEMAVVDQKPRSATAIAKTDCRVIAINHESLEQIIQTTPEFSLKLIRLLSQKLRQSNNIISELLTKDKKNTIIGSLKTYAEEQGEKTFKGKKIHLLNFLNWAKQRIGIEQDDIQTILKQLIHDEFICYAAKSEENIILLEKLLTYMPII
ncbi:Crp/Fnr family transcriptional regulator [Spirochaetota bacterium]